MSIEAQRQALAVNYLTAYHPLITARIAAQSMTHPLNGDSSSFFQGLKDAILGKSAADPQAQAAAGGVQAAADSGTQVPSGLSNLLGAGTVTALYNVYRIQSGKQPVQAADLAGVSSTTAGINFLPWAISAAILLFAGRGLFR